jgi:hypothetical protein
MIIITRFYLLFSIALSPITDVHHLKNYFSVPIFEHIPSLAVGLVSSLFFLVL